MIRKTRFSSYNYIAFTVGVDATVVVKSCKLFESYREIVGGSYPNNFWDINKISDDEILNLMK